MSSELLAEYSLGTSNFIRAAEAILPEKLNKTPADNQWSPANIIHHLADSEAHFYLRYLRILTEEIPETNFFDENVYPKKLQYPIRDVALSLNLLKSLRESFYDIMSNFAPEDWGRKGRNSNVGEYPIIALIKKSRTHINDHLKQLNETVEIL